MRSPIDTTSPARGRLATAVFAAVILCAAVIAALAPLASEAPAQTTREKLDNVRAKQDRLAEELSSQNREINSLVGRVSQLRSRESKANDELTQLQAEVEETGGRLDQGKDDLEALRTRYKRSQKALKGMLVDLYKAGEDDLAGALTDARDLEQLGARSEYAERLQDYRLSLIDRVVELKDQTDALVAQLADDLDRVEAARDETAEQRDQLTAARSELEGRQADLSAAKAQRRASLRHLAGREENLVEILNTPPEPPSYTPPPPAANEPAPVSPGGTATLGSDGKATAPANAPQAVKNAIAAANAISDRPYVWGGGHGSFESSGYDCSGAVSYALNGGGLLDSPLDSTGLMFWGAEGMGKWITVYAHGGHAYVVIAGLRFDTSGGAGPRWHADARSSAGFVARHPPGL